MQQLISLVRRAEGRINESDSEFQAQAMADKMENFNLGATQEKSFQGIGGFQI